MSAKECGCSDPVAHARAVESAVFFALQAAMNRPDQEGHWRAHADKLEQKFTTQHGKHYSLFLRRA